MRLIDADALLMNMNLAIAILEGTMKNLGLQDDAECQMELKAYRNIRDGIKDEPTAEPTAQPEQRWIPCSERLPDKQRYCLTSCRNGLVCEDFHWNNGYFDKADKYHHEVIAWMPLPEPYRGGDTE